MGCNLAEVGSFIDQIEKVREKIRQDESYRLDVLNHGEHYERLKKYLGNFASFLRYSEEVHCNCFYRVRKTESDTPYKTVKDLKYPDPDVRHEDRMNNTSFRVLYTSLHEFTALAETRIDKNFIGKRFQLTKFSLDKPLKTYRLGMFSELYLNNPRDSEAVRERARDFLGSGDHDRTIQGYSALEVAMSNILYDKEKDYHILSSILADAIFSTGTNIEAIMYPSMQNRYGINVALNKESADALDISYSTMNRITEVHRNGYFRYATEMECTDFLESNNLIYTPVESGIMYR
jgi:hypothetical protein